MKKVNKQCLLDTPANQGSVKKLIFLKFQPADRTLLKLDFSRIYANDL